MVLWCGPGLIVFLCVCVCVRGWCEVFLIWVGMLDLVWCERGPVFLCVPGDRYMLISTYVCMAQSPHVCKTRGVHTQTRVVTTLCQSPGSGGVGVVVIIMVDHGPVRGVGVVTPVCIKSEKGWRKGVSQCLAGTSAEAFTHTHARI